MISLTEIYLENFRSWENLCIQDMDKKGLCLIYGSNGSGKSSIRQAVEYLLLDRTSDSIPVSDLIRNNDKSCKLYCKLIKDNTIIEITKYRNHDEYGNKIFLIINGDDSLTYTDRRETQKEILNLLDIDANYLFSSSIFSSNTNSFIELNDNSKKDILYKICSLDKYTTYFDKADEKCKSIKADLDDLNRKKSAFTKQLEIYKQELEDLEEKSRNFDKTIAIEIENKNKEVDYMRKTIRELEDSLGDLDQNCINIELDIDNLEKEKKNNEIEISSLQKQHEEIVENIHNLESDVRHLGKDLDNISSSVCPILNVECSSLKSSIEYEQSKRSEINKIKNKIEQLTNEKKKIKDKIEGLSNVDNKINKKYEELSKVKHKITNANENIRLNKRDIGHTGKVIEDLYTRENHYVELIEDKKRLINKINKKVELTENKIEELIHIYDYFLFWKEGFSKKGIPNLKIESFISQIEEIVNNNLSIMKDPMYVSIEGTKTISTGDAREEISYVVNHPNKSIKNYKSYSGGEKQRLKIADLFAFASMFSKLNVLVLDEVLELSLDDLGKEEIFELLRDQSRRFGSVLVISHSNTLQDKFDNIIYIEKEDGVSILK